MYLYIILEYTNTYRPLNLFGVAEGVAQKLEIRVGTFNPIYMGLTEGMAQRFDIRVGEGWGWGWVGVGVWGLWLPFIYFSWIQYIRGGVELGLGYLYISLEYTNT